MCICIVLYCVFILSAISLSFFIGKCYSTVGNFSRPVCNCSRQAGKVYRPVGNFYRLGHRVGKICKRQAINNNRQACNTNRQAGNCNRQAGNIFASYGLSVSKSVGMKMRVGRQSVYIWTSTCRETTWCATFI